MKIIKINDCSECPHCYSYDDEENKCHGRDFQLLIPDYPNPSDNCPFKPSEIDNEVLVNNIELASELAYNEVVKDLVDPEQINDDDNFTCEEDLYDTDENGD